MFSLGGFNLTKWTSNSTQVIKSVEEEHLGAKDSRNDARSLERVKWKPDSDQFIVEAMKFETLKNVDITQRKLLKFTSPIFDPLGITVPLTLRLRLSLQLAWTNLETSIGQSSWLDIFVRAQGLDRRNLIFQQRGATSNVLPTTIESNRYSTAPLQRLLRTCSGICCIPKDRFQRQHSGPKICNGKSPSITHQKNHYSKTGASSCKQWNQTSQVCERTARHHNQQLDTYLRQHTSSSLDQHTQSGRPDLQCPPP